MILYNFDKNTANLLIKIKGNLDDILMPEVRFCCNHYKSNVKRITLDCQAVTYIDSSFIPFLIKLRREARNNNFNIIFCNMNDTILHEFRLLNLHKLFSPVYNEQKLTVFWQLFP